MTKELKEDLGPSSSSPEHQSSVRQRQDVCAALIARLEKATGPDRRLDCAIYVALGAKRPTRKTALYWTSPDGKTQHYEALIPYYTGSIDAARTAVPEGWWITLRFCKNKGAAEGFYHAELQTDPYIAARDFDEHEELEITANNAPTPAIALCIAALKAIAMIATPANTTALYA